MPIENPPSYTDLRAARVLLRKKQSELAATVGVTTLTIINLEKGRAIRDHTLASIIRAFRSNDVEFGAPGFVSLHGRRAPTREAVGVLTGARMRAARYAVRGTPGAVGAVAKVDYRYVHLIEKLEDCSKGVREIKLYAVFSALEDMGFFFGRTAGQDFLKFKRPSWEFA